MRALKKLISIDETISLQDNWSFWLAVLFFPTLAIALSIVPFREEVQGTCFSSQCYSDFLEIFKFPIWLSSGSIIFGVMVGRFHGSKQRSAKLSMDIRDESFKRYYEHRTFIKGYADTVLKNSSIWTDKFIKNPEFDLNRFYKNIYPDNSPKTGFKYKPIKSLEEFVYPTLIEVKKSIREIVSCVSNSRESQISFRRNICAGALRKMFETLFIISNEPIGSDYSYMNNKDVVLVDSLKFQPNITTDDLRYFVCHILLEVILDILKFCEVDGEFESAREEVGSLFQQFALDRAHIEEALMLVYSEPVY
jgi:hypothetical protein